MELPVTILPAQLNARLRSGSQLGPGHPLAKSSAEEYRLPEELVHHLSDYLDKSSLIRFGSTCRQFTPQLDHRLWVDLNLYLPPRYGDVPAVRVPIEADGPLGQLSKAAKEISYTREATLTHLIGKRIAKGRSRDWANVKTLRIQPERGSAQALVQVLGLVQGNLEMLEILGLGSRFPTDAPYILKRGTLQEKMIGSHLSFTRITHVVIRPGAVWSGDICLRLCEAAPALIALNVELGCHGMSPGISTTGTQFPPTMMTRIERLRFSLCGSDGSEDPEAVRVVREIVRVSPDLRQVILPFRGYQKQANEGLLEALADHESLQELYWPVEANAFWRASGELLFDDSFPSLLRCCLGPSTNPSWEYLASGVIVIISLTADLSVRPPNPMPRCARIVLRLLVHQHSGQAHCHWRGPGDCRRPSLRIGLYIVGRRPSHNTYATSTCRARRPRSL